MKTLKDLVVVVILAGLQGYCWTLVFVDEAGSATLLSILSGVWIGYIFGAQSKSR